MLKTFLETPQLISLTISLAAAQFDGFGGFSGFTEFSGFVPDFQESYAESGNELFSKNNSYG